MKKKENLFEKFIGTTDVAKSLEKEKVMLSLLDLMEDDINQFGSEADKKKHKENKIKLKKLIKEKEKKIEVIKNVFDTITEIKENAK